jgi:chromosome segregation ATPase
MYGDTGVMRKRVSDLREQGDDIRATADHLVSRTESIEWSGRAGDALRDRVRERATHLRHVATAHDAAADSLERHLLQVDDAKEAIEDAERRARQIASDAEPAMPPPSGHKDWLAVETSGP